MSRHARDVVISLMAGAKVAEIDGEKFRPVSECERILK